MTKQLGNFSEFLVAFLSTIRIRYKSIICSNGEQMEFF